MNYTLKRWLCALGIHSWIYTDLTVSTKRRYCEHCRRQEQESVTFCGSKFYRIKDITYDEIKEG